MTNGDLALMTLNADGIKEVFRACLLGGALGDALGYAVEFMRMEQIRGAYGEKGIQGLCLDMTKGKAIISDDTQMTLFTADGLMNAHIRTKRDGMGSPTESGIYQSYMKWLYTQTNDPNGKKWLHRNECEYLYSFCIEDIPDLYERRAPGMTCLSALESNLFGTIEHPINQSKGCGGVMRVAPIGLFYYDEPWRAFEVACEAAALTHGHPTGFLSAGFFAMMIAFFVGGKKTLHGSIMRSLDYLREHPDYEETEKAITKAIQFAYSDKSPEVAIRSIGEGWVAEEALAIAIYCALKGKDFTEAVTMAVNHDGDSDSTGAICGNLLGACYGMRGIPSGWVEYLELADFIIKTADLLIEVKQNN
ncbi:MAG: ADP-ribosylglycohydrolase family protein [Lachnospiraceae bacterium]|jgi:ADP-ribosylglycohydrolase|nr:ADP-ribosylglycohydrolase family protein [Lachnospiraceae bacterium]